jgi:hypothetical protein
MRAATISAICIAATLGFARSACADVIDGSWCHEKGSRMTIDGPIIITPTGTRTEGNYSRHFFSYVVPDGDPGAGALVKMRLLNEETVQVQAGPEAPWVIWHRCQPTISLLWRAPPRAAEAHWRLPIPS